jgi:hypothetical protein
MLDGVAIGRAAAARLAAIGQVKIGPGLAEDELSRIETEFGFEFAADHRAFLAAGLPLNTPPPDEPGVFYTWQEPWPDWRDGDREQLWEQVNWPVDRAVEQVAHGFWVDAWGARPADHDEAAHIAGERLRRVPRLVPVYGHRFLPAGRDNVGHPVLSVWHIYDIICYGNDLIDYIDAEFAVTERPQSSKSPRPSVPFWSDYL